MKHVPVKLGPLALLLAVVAICLTILAILSFTTGQADLRLAQRYADTVSERYALEAEGQQYVAIVNEGRRRSPVRTRSAARWGPSCRRPGRCTWISC